MQRVLIAVSITLGILIGYVDSRPTWDDTGVTVVSLFLVTAAFGALAPQRPWRWALCVGVWIPLFEMPGANYGSLMALVIAFLGAYTGASGGSFIRRRRLGMANRGR